MTSSKHSLKLYITRRRRQIVMAFITLNHRNISFASMALFASYFTLSTSSLVELALTSRLTVATCNDYFSKRQHFPQKTEQVKMKMYYSIFLYYSIGVSS